MGQCVWIVTFRVSLAEWITLFMVVMIRSPLDTGTIEPSSTFAWTFFFSNLREYERLGLGPFGVLDRSYFLSVFLLLFNPDRHYFISNAVLKLLFFFLRALIFLLFSDRSLCLIHLREMCLVGEAGFPAVDFFAFHPACLV